MELNRFGWNVFFEQAFKNNYNDEYFTGRVISVSGNSYKILTSNSELQVEQLINEKVAVGDFVVLKDETQQVLIKDILPRVSTYSKLDDLLASNFDTLFMVYACNHIDLKQIERDVIKIWETGATPVIVLTKADLTPDYQKRLAEVKLVAPGVDVYAVSSTLNIGTQELLKYVKPGKTIVMLGSSNEGKSTLIKTFSGRSFVVHDRELCVLPNGCMIIDLNEEKIMNYHNVEQESFDDVDELASNCRFHNCTHLREPGCAIINAVEEGVLSKTRYEDYLKEHKSDTEFSVDDDLHFDHRKKYKEMTYTKSKRREQW